MLETKSQQLYQELKKRIVGGIYPAGGQLPKELELAAELRVSRKTLRLALDQLSRQNLIERIKRKGTFVRQDNRAKYKILLIVNENQTFYSPYPYIMPGIQTAAEAANIRIESCMLQSLVSLAPEEAVRNIIGNQPDGIICLVNNFVGHEPLLKILQATKIPVLLPHAAPDDAATTGFATLSMDYGQIMRDGLQYLKGQGHQRIGTIFWQGSGRGISVAGYLEWQREIGVNGSLDYFREISDFAAIPAAMQDLLALPCPPTAIISYSDFIAIRIYQYLKDRKIRIPEDLAILSIGGHIGCNYLTPTLSAVDFDLQGIGSHAIEVLMDIICHKKSEAGTMPQMISPHHIVERQSTNYIIKHEKLKTRS